jgi:hypothetical protein
LTQPVRAIAIALLLCGCSRLTAQDTPSVAVAAPAPIIKGPNFSLATTSQHDSSNGWSSVLTPNFAWRFNRHYSADTSVPFYDYINVLVTGGTKAKPTYAESTKHFVAGDTAVNGHLDLNPALLSYNLTVTLGLPSGNDTYGLGAGQVTYNVNNHFEKDFDLFSPDIEIGIGDSSALVGGGVRKSYVSVGTLAHFQAGTSVDLSHNINFEADAYEELPIAAQTLYSTTGKGKKKVTTATGTSVAEDNGFTTELDIPLNGHVTLSGFYNRSLRNKIDTAGFTITFLLRQPPHEAAKP